MRPPLCTLLVFSQARVKGSPVDSVKWAAKYRKVLALKEVRGGDGRKEGRKEG